MKKKRYTMPTTQVVCLQHYTPLLLPASGNTELDVEYGEENW